MSNLNLNKNIILLKFMETSKILVFLSFDFLYNIKFLSDKSYKNLSGIICFYLHYLEEVKRNKIIKI